MAATTDLAWRSRRALARIEPIVEPILAEHATTFWRRGMRRRDVDGRVTWTIDNELVLEVRFAERGPATLVVHDFSVLEPLRRALRTRHVRVRLATHRDA